MRPLLALALFLLLAAPLAAQPALPGDSVYNLDVGLVDQNARAVPFATLGGDVRVVSMFYASCPYVCPLIIDTIKTLEHALPEPERARLRVLLVSLDPERDTPQALQAVVTQRRLDGRRWTLARTDPTSVRKLAAVLGIQYRQLENREFNHSSALILLDAQGRVLARSSLLGEADPEFVAALRRALAATAASVR